MTGKVIIFTDLDGTLLDHETYSYIPARPLLDCLVAQKIPVILATSKTAAELLPLRESLGLSACPAIVENGAGLLPAGGGLPPGTGDYARLRQALADLPPDLRACFTGFGDWSVEELATRTGLPPEAAAAAKARNFSEPGLFHGTGDRRRAFLDNLMSRGVQAREGGRYLTLSFGATKADRMAEIRQNYPAAKTAIALGDAPNDVEMLTTADIGVIIPNPARDPLPPLPGEDTGRIRRARRPGPEGWAQSLRAILTAGGHLKETETPCQTSSKTEV